MKSSREWYVRRSNTSSCCVNAVSQPALKLRPFFRGLANADRQHRGMALEVGEDGGSPLFGTTQLQRCSPSMRQLPSMDKEHARMWVKYWKSRNYV